MSLKLTDFAEFVSFAFDYESIIIIKTYTHLELKCYAICSSMKKFSMRLAAVSFCVLHLC